MPWAYALIGMLNLVALWWTEEGCVSAEALAEQLAALVWPGLDGRPVASISRRQRPPETVMICPVTQLPASLAR